MGEILLTYYTAQEHFEKLFEQTLRPLRYRATTPQEHRRWSEELRACLTALTGMDRMQPCPPRPRQLETVACDGYTRYKLVIDTEPDVSMPFYLLMPDGLGEGERRTAVIACHGHSSNGKESVAGVEDGGCVSRAIAHYSYAYGVELVRRGYIVLAPDARGFGERRERYDQGMEDAQRMSSSCAYLNRMAMPLGQTVTGMWTWDLMRLTDYALTRPEVNGHIACVGLSGGGLQSLWLGAMDSRIECCVVSGYFYGYSQSLLTNLNCSCNYVPHLWENVDIGDVGALLAPRPLLIETGDEDALNGKDNLGNVIPQVDVVRRAMRVFDKAENIQHDIFHGEHQWHGALAYPWLLRHTPPVREDK